MSHIAYIIAFFVAIGILFGYVKPTWSGDIAETKLAIKASEEALTASAQYSAQQNELASARNAINPDFLKQLEVFLPDSVDNVGLILDINSLATRSGIALSNINVDIPEDSEGEATESTPFGLARVGSINLSLSAIGTYNAFRTFLESIERSARLLDVQDISVKGSETGVYEYQMTIRLYWLQ
jgi:Tfp pilus assembly protein PilO